MADLPRILLVDDSRVVRLTLAQQLKKNYDIREECDGEAAWQALVLDHSLRAVISDLQMPKLTGLELVQRMRASKLKRIKNLPFVLVSGEETESERQKALNCGVSDFITKGLNTAQILARVDRLLQTGQTLPTPEGMFHDDITPPVRKAPPAQPAPQPTPQVVVPPPPPPVQPVQTAPQPVPPPPPPMMPNSTDTALPHKNQLETLVGQALAHAHSYHEDLSLMILSFDNYDELISRLGHTAAEEICKRFIRILSDKMRKGDTLTQYASGQYAVISANTPLKACAAFAERVRKAVNVASLSVRGQNIALTVSIGLSGVSDDNPSSAQALLELTASRMQLAAQSGGNRVVTSGGTVEKMPLITALQFLNAGKAEAVFPHLPALAVEIYPLLEILQQHWQIPMPLAQLQQLLRRR